VDRREFQLRARFRKAIRTAQIEDGSTLLVAVSGGCDSLCLLHLILGERRQRRWKVWVAHVNHGLRPDAADDAQFVRAIAKERGVPSIGMRIEPRVWDQGGSVEERARAYRSRALRRMARKVGASVILLGHNRDDQAETLLIRLLRGSGLRGLAGIALVSGNSPRLVRPLLEIPRNELRMAARGAQLEWREDPSNSDPRILRNRVRILLLPMLEEEFQPGAGKVLARTAASLATARAWLEQETDRAWNELAPSREGTAIRLDRPRLASYHEVLIEGIIRRAFSSLSGSARGLGSAHVHATLRALRDPRPRQIHFPGRVTGKVNRRVFEMVLRVPPPAGRDGASNGS
jgi:tRNA(Ile)-lysidine synthase